MRILGFEIGRAARQAEKSFTSITDNRGWWPIVFEAFAGAWQQNVVIDRTAVLTQHAVYACMTLIATDIAKLRIKLMAPINDGDVWMETTNPAYSPVLRRQNDYQNRIQFIESWLLSKLTRGNTYVLKQRDMRGVVVKLFVLNPIRVRPLVASTGEVFYELGTDYLTGLGGESVIVPAREIIHDRMNCLFHPLVGTSPLTAAGLAAMTGIKIQEQSTWFFANRSMPGGILTAPGAIKDETASRLKAAWETNFSGPNAGRVAVLGDGLKFEKVPISAEEAQLIEQLKWSGEVICSVFHVPAYKVGLTPLPTHTNVQALNTEYYSQCLQGYIEALELCLDEGLALDPLGTEFDIDGLLRMDTATQMAGLKDAVGAGVMAPNEARERLDLPPVVGGDSPYLQQQNYSLEALAKRDAKPDPFQAATAPQPAAPAGPQGGDTAPPGDQGQPPAKAAVRAPLAIAPPDYAGMGDALADELRRHAAV
jgi:HK97 family phage portal protein